MHCVQLVPIVLSWTSPIKLLPKLRKTVLVTFWHGFYFVSSSGQVTIFILLDQLTSDTIVQSLLVQTFSSLGFQYNTFPGFPLITWVLFFSLYCYILLLFLASTTVKLQSSVFRCPFFSIFTQYLITANLMASNIIYMLIIMKFIIQYRSLTRTLVWWNYQYTISFWLFNRLFKSNMPKSQLLILPMLFSDSLSHLSLC